MKPEMPENTPQNSDDSSGFDYQLLRLIGQGSYGEVWIARDASGQYRACKVVHRERFDHERPYEREYAGIQKFEPISQANDNQIKILHVGRRDNEGYFYYVMELADDVASGQLINPETYAARTIKTELKQKGRLPMDECIRIGCSLAAALSHLHENGLIHRDIKPANVIFVNDVPKLADIGLLTNADVSISYVGTEGFIPPEGPTSPQADIYSLGKVLYEMSTGRDRLDYPELPENFETLPDREAFLELNTVIARACETDVRKRYQSAQEMLSDLAWLSEGKSIRKKRQARQKQFMALGAVVVLVLLSFLVASIVSMKKRSEPSSTPVVKEPTDTEPMFDSAGNQVIESKRSDGTRTPNPPYLEIGSWYNSTAKSSVADLSAAGSRYAASNTAAFTVTPTLAAGETYSVETTQSGVGSQPTNIIVAIAATGCSGLPAITTAFQRYNPNRWKWVGNITLLPGVTKPTLTFGCSALSGEINFNNRFYFDAIRFVRQEKVVIESHSDWSTVNTNADSGYMEVSGNWFTSLGKSALPDLSAPRSRFISSTTNNPTFKILPPLKKSGNYLVDIAQCGIGNQSRDVIFAIAQTNCSGLPSTTSIFQRGSGDAWKRLGIMRLTSELPPEITFSYLQGTLDGENRVYFDAIRFLRLEKDAAPEQSASEGAVLNVGAKNPPVQPGAIRISSRIGDLLRLEIYNDRIRCWSRGLSDKNKINGFSLGNFKRDETRVLKNSGDTLFLDHAVDFSTAKLTINHQQKKSSKATLDIAKDHVVVELVDPDGGFSNLDVTVNFGK